MPVPKHAWAFAVLPGGEDSGTMDGADAAAAPDAENPADDQIPFSERDTKPVRRSLIPRHSTMRVRSDARPTDSPPRREPDPDDTLPDHVPVDNRTPTGARAEDERSREPRRLSPEPYSTEEEITHTRRRTTIPCPEVTAVASQRAIAALAHARYVVVTDDETAAVHARLVLGDGVFVQVGSYTELLRTITEPFHSDTLAVLVDCRDGRHEGTHVARLLEHSAYVRRRVVFWGAGSPTGGYVGCAFTTCSEEASGLEAALVLAAFAL